MRCKKHLSDLSSTVGVCATCLRERLIDLIAAQAHSQAHTQAQLTRGISRASEERSRNSDPSPQPLPQPLNFPRSVSPYVSRRKSDYAALHGGADHRDRLFYSTPQLGPAFYGGADNGIEKPLKKRLSKFWSFSNLFRSRSEKLQPDPSYEDSSSSSPSLFSTIFHTLRKNKDRTRTTEDYSSVGERRRHRRMDRGMSPVRTEGLGDDCDQSPSGSGYSSETSPWWRKTPKSARRSRLGSVKSVGGSGMAFCLSPLVRASPNRRWNHKGLLPDMSSAAEVRATAAKPHLSTASSFCANRSRKLADFGRVNHNR